MSIPLPAPGFYPFWFWNGVQCEKEISYQLAEMASSGCKGAVLHSRTGNKIEYLSSRWLDLVEYACIEAEKLGLKIWLYDEDGFPSGNASHMVQKLRPDLKQKSLHFEYGKSDPEHPAYAAFKLNELTYVDEKAIPPGTPVLRLNINVIDTHVDTLNPETVRVFINLTHEKYAERCGRFFGNTIEAVYTDDESFLIFSEHCPVWSETLIETLENKLGRDVKPLLAALIEDTPDSPWFRQLYYQTAQELFLKNFITPQRDWCRSHGLIYTGHLCGDEGPRGNAIKNYNSAGAYHDILDIPAIDDYLLDMRDLGYLKRPYTGNDFRIYPGKLKECYPLYTHKLASSCANIKGTGRVSSEVWTFLGWDMPIDFIEKQTLFEISMLQTLLTPHAFYYTLDGEAMNDCPPSYFFQQPCWEMFKKKIPIWSSIAEKFTSSQSCAETLFIVPDSLAQYLDKTAFTNYQKSELFTYDHKIQIMILELMRNHVDFDILEENQLNNIKKDNNSISIGCMKYNKLIVPSFIELSSKTATLISGIETFDETTLADIPAAWDIADAQELLVTPRRGADGKIFYFLQNLSGKSMELKGEFPQGKRLHICDPVRRDCVFYGTTFPDNFTLAHGEVVILQEEADFDSINFEHSVFYKNAVQEIPFTENHDTYSFNGIADILHLEMTDGVAAVSINGSEPIVLWGTGEISVHKFCTDEKNTFTVDFQPSAGVVYGSLKNARIDKISLRKNL